jgi:hypothetical protein
MKRFPSRLRCNTLSTLLLVLLPSLMGGCMDARPRPTPVEAVIAARLSVQVLAPRAGQAVAAGTDVLVRVNARDLDNAGLEGVGYIARRFIAGRPVVDSATFRFAARADTTHEFLLRIPASMPSNSQIDIYGLAYGRGGQTGVSTPSYIIAVRCVNGVCQ